MISHTPRSAAAYSTRTSEVGPPTSFARDDLAARVPVHRLTGRRKMREGPLESLIRQRFVGAGAIGTVARPPLRRSRPPRGAGGGLSRLPLYPSPDAHGQGGHLLLWDLQNANTPAGPSPLLPIVGDARRQGHDMPVDVGVVLVGTEGKDVHP